jgi:probable rRNA maturation factor
MINVSVTNAQRRERCPASLIARSVRMVLRGEGYRAADISVVCVNDGVSRRINTRFLRHDFATDVISFPLGEGDAVEGELYVNLDRVRVQARRYCVSRSTELVRLVIHGVLHLIGYDDQTARERGRMHEREDVYLARLFGRLRKELYERSCR